MIVDKGHDFPQDIEEKLLSYGHDMWLLREQPDRGTTRALNSYHGDRRGSVDINSAVPAIEID
jgi:hypothetical protein